MVAKQINTGYKIALDWTSIFVFIFILISNDTFLWGTNSISFFVTFPRYFSILLCAYLLFKKRVIKEIHFPMQIVYFLIIVLYLTSCILTKCTVTITGIYFIYITLAYLICTRINFHSFFDKFEKVIFFICVYSLIIEVIAYIMPSLISLFPIMVNTSGVSIYNCGFSGIICRYFNTALIRNNGIFWEPGVFQIYINLALLYIVFFKPEKLSQRIVIYGLSVLITFSTTGYIAFFFILFIVLKSSNVKKNHKIILSVLIGLTIVSVFFLDFEFSVLASGVFGKIFDSSNGSKLQRVASVVADFEMAKSSPLFGVGMSSIDDQMIKISRETLGIYANSNSNGLLYQLAAFGIPFEIIYLSGMATFSFNYSNMKIDRLLICILIVILFISERLISPMPYIMMFYGFICYFYNKYSIRTVNNEQNNREDLV